MRRFFGFALGVSALLLFGNTATAQKQGFPGLGITLSYPNYLPVFNQPEIPGTHRWGYGQYAAGKATGECSSGHGSSYCAGHQPYFPQTIYGQNYGPKGPVANNTSPNSGMPPMGRAQGVGNFGGPYYGGQHGTSQIANPSATPFYFSTR